MSQKFRNYYKPFFCFLFLWYFILPANCQETAGIENDQKIIEIVINSAAYIFEGTVLQTKNYTTQAGRPVTQAILEIHKVFRGDLKPGTIEMVTCPEGWFFNKEEQKWAKYSLEHSFGNCGFEVGKTDIFLGNKSSTAFPNTDCPVTNKFVMEQIDRIHYTINKRYFYSEYSAYLSGGQIAGLYKSFRRLPDLYEFLLKAPNTKLTDFDQRVFVKSGRDGQPIKN